MPVSHYPDWDAFEIGSRPADRPVAFWRSLYQRLRTHHFGGGWLRKAWQKKFQGIEAIDSSTFRLMARLRDVFLPSGSGGAKKGSANSKGALKIHQVYQVGDELPADEEPVRLLEGDDRA